MKKLSVMMIRSVGTPMAIRRRISRVIAGAYSLIDTQRERWTCLVLST